MKLPKSVFLFLGAAVSLSDISADDAKVLPQGRFRVRYAIAYTTSSNQFDNNGDSNALGAVFTRTLDARTLAAVDPRFKIKLRALHAAESTPVASVNTQIDMSIWTHVFCVEYGLSDRISVGFLLPLVQGSVNVRSSTTPASGFNSVNINTLLQSQLQYSHALTNWDETGLGDLEVGGKYNYYQDHPLMMTIKTGARFPTGRTKDPNNLVDFGFGDGQYDVGAYHYIDYQALANLFFTLETGYTFQFANSGNYRVPLSAELPIGPQPVAMDRKLGDYYEIGTEANYTFFRNFMASAKYHFLQKFSDSYSGGPKNADLSSLSTNTSEILHEGQFQLEYSSLPDVKAGRSKLPYGFALFYRQPFLAQNTIDSRTFGAQLKAYF